MYCGNRTSLYIICSIFVNSNQTYIGFSTHYCCCISIHFIIQMFDDRLKYISLPCATHFWNSGQSYFENRIFYHFDRPGSLLCTVQIDPLTVRAWKHLWTYFDFWSCERWFARDRSSYLFILSTFPIFSPVSTLYDKIWLFNLFDIIVGENFCCDRNFQIFKQFILKHVWPSIIFKTTKHDF